MKLKNKLKNFFSVDIEKDLHEEECTKKFEKIKLFTLTRTNIFIGLFLFLLVINALIVFDVDFIYLRQILGFLFLIAVPGLVLMLCFKIRDIGFWEYLVYTVGLSISFIMFAGLIVNWTLPLLNITDKPLSLFPILICFDIFLIILGVVAFYRNKDFKPKPFTLPKLDTTNNIFFIIPMFFPVLAILGAFLLNNNGPNILTMIMLGGIAVYVLFLTIYRKQLNKNIWPWALWMIGLSLLMSGWMRGWFVTGTDTSLEYWIFELTYKNSFWNIFNFYNYYDGMLSLTILPTILSHFMKINNQFIFKLIIPLIFSTISIIIYLISRKILSPLFCFFSVLFFLLMPDFLTWYAIPIRQEIAFLFFGLISLSLFTKKLKLKSKKILFVIFGGSMIVSHYSTAYIALAIFILSYLITLIYKIHENKKVKKGKLYPVKKTEFYLTGILILLLLLFGFLWYSQVTPTSNGLINFAEKSISNFGDIFNTDIRQGGVTDPIFSLFDKIEIGNLIEKYENQSLKYDLSNKPGGFSKETYTNYKIVYLQSEFINSKVKFINPFKINYYAKQIVSRMFQLFILIGAFYFIFNKNIKGDIRNIFIGSSMIIFLLLFLPLFSIRYGLTRSIQQILVLLSPLSILGGKIFFKKLKINPLKGLAFLIIIFFLFFSGFSSQLMGGDTSKTQLNNFGENYNINYMFDQDFVGINWLNANHKNLNLYSDASSALKINSGGGEFSFYNLNRNLLPNTVSREAYVYLSTINTRKGMGFFPINNMKIGYNLPIEFLNDNKNKIYNNGGSEVFK